MSRTELIDAVFFDDVPRVLELLAEDASLVDAVADPKLTPDQTAGFSALHLAVYRGNAGLVKILVKHGADLNACNEDGRTPLHVALEYNNTTTHVLLELGANVDVCAAAALGRVDRLRELLDADAALVDDRSTHLSPMGWAAYFCAVPSVEELIARGARLDDGSLLCAASVNCVAVGEILLSHGVDPDSVPPEWGGNALHAAAAMRYTEDSSDFVRFLLDRGADVNLRTLSGRTALEIVEEAARVTEVSERKRQSYGVVAELLRAHGATA
jgi:ankyrin repeat protein